MIYRYFLMQMHDINRIFEVTIWPIQDVLFMGFIAVWMQKGAGAASQSALIPLVGVFFWQIVVRAHMDMATCVMEEFWNRNLANLFSSPLRLTEWLCALVLFSAARVAAALSLCAVIVWTFYHYNVLVFGWWLCPLIMLFLCSGLITGLVAAGLIMRWGQRMAVFAWMAWLLTPFCGAFNPISILPSGMQMIGKVLPMTYPFMCVQQFVMTGTMSVSTLYLSFVINGIYLIGAWLFFGFMFNRAKVRGLAQLEVD